MVRLKSVFAFVALLAMSSVSYGQGSWGGMYVTAGAAAQALSVTAAKFTGFVTALPSSATNGDTSVTTVIASDQVTLAANGSYMISYSYSGTADATTLITFSLRDAGAAITGATTRVNHPAATNVTAVINFIYKPTVDATLSVYAVAASGTPSITATDAQLVIRRLE